MQNEVEDRLRSSDESGEITNITRLACFAIALVVLWTVAGGFAFLTNQPENVLTTSWQKAVKTSVQTVVPEQWGFFTRSPREDELLPYRWDGAKWTSVSAYPHSQAKYLFGWNRSSRAQGIEIGLLFKEASGQEWRDCDPDKTAVNCLKGLTASAGWLPVTNPSPDPTICGRSALSRALPPPWAWANIGQPKQHVSVVLMDVAC